MSTDEPRGDPEVSASIRMTPDTRIAVHRLPGAVAEIGGAVPRIWVYFGLGSTNLSATPADLTRLRDALTEALDAEQGDPS